MEMLSTVTFDQLQNSLSPTALLHFHRGQQYPLIKINARDLLNPRRLDLGVKIRFYKSITGGSSSDFEKNLYAAHLAVWNGFFETTPAKFGPADYVESFKRLIDDRDKIDFGKLILPVDQDFTLLDGAHRAAIAALHDREIVVVQAPHRANVYNYQYFQNRCKGLPAETSNLLLDQMAYSYCLFKDSVRAICIMPATKGQFRDEIEEQIQRNCEVVYKKKFKLSREVFDLFILHLYSEDATGWVGTFEDGFRGAKIKASRCYNPDEELVVYFVDSLTNEAAIALKADIRSRFDLDKDACHIGDTHRETLTIAGMLLNPAWPVLQAIPLNRSVPVFERSLAILNAFIKEHNLDRNDFCVGGSALLSLLGHRDCGDLDLLIARNNEHVSLPSGLGSHRNQLAYYPVSFEEIISDPSLHFFFLGMKFARPEVILQFKRKRNETPKDLKDILALLQSFPNLDFARRSGLSQEGIMDAAQTTLDKTIREQERVINEYRNTIHTWYVPELRKLENLLNVAQLTSENQKQQIASLNEQLEFLEKMVQERARAG